MLPIITIDGPSGSGKGTLSRKLAKLLGWNLLDSGLIYRVFATLALDKHINLQNEKLLLKILDSSIKISFVQEKGNFVTFCNNKVVNENIYTEIIANVASQISMFTKIRSVLSEYQRSFYILPGLIADGRDMGTAIFPNAAVKIFLNASPSERNQRKLEQFQINDFHGGSRDLSFQIRERDQRDCNRRISPLVPATDALVLDSTYLSKIEVENEVISYIKKKMVYNIT